MDITIPKRYNKDFTPDEKALFNHYVAAYKREYRQREDVKAKEYRSIQHEYYTL